MTFRPRRQQDGISDLFALACDDLGINTNRVHEDDVTYDTVTGQFTMMTRTRNPKVFVVALTLVSETPAPPGVAVTPATRVLPAPSNQ